MPPSDRYERARDIGPAYRIAARVTPNGVEYNVTLSRTRTRTHTHTPIVFSMTTPSPSHSNILNKLAAKEWKSEKVADMHFIYKPVTDIPGFLLHNIEIKAQGDTANPKFNITFNFQDITKEQYEEFAKLCMKSGSQYLGLPPYEAGKATFTIENAEWHQLYALGLVLNTERALASQFIKDQNPDIAEGLQSLSRIPLINEKSFDDVARKINNHVAKARNKSATEVDVAEIVLDINSKVVTDHSESSMSALRADQLEALFILNEKYSSSVNTDEQQADIIQSIIEFCEKTYKGNQAKFTYMRKDAEGKPNDITVTLPLTYSGLQNLITIRKLTTDEVTEIYQQYYQDPIHSAYRFLKEYDEWMAPDAQFKQLVRNGNGVEMYTAIKSDFDIRLICMSWLAINAPENIERADDMRKMFLGVGIHDCLRGHNRDFGEDDMHGDAPSCGGGTTQRIFNGLMNTRLPAITFPSVAEVLSPSGILGDILREVYREKFEKLTDKDKVWNVLDKEGDNWYLTNFPEPTSADFKLLASLNITKDELSLINKRITDQLLTKYPILSRKPRLKTALIKELQEQLAKTIPIVDNARDIIKDIHMNKFYTDYGLDKILATLKSTHRSKI